MSSLSQDHDLAADAATVSERSAPSSAGQGESAAIEALKTAAELQTALDRYLEPGLARPCVEVGGALANAAIYYLRKLAAPVHPGLMVGWLVKDFADGWFFYNVSQLAEATRAECDGFRVEPVFVPLGGVKPSPAADDGLSDSQSQSVDDAQRYEPKILSSDAQSVRPDGGEA